MGNTPLGCSYLNMFSSLHNIVFNSFHLIFSMRSLLAQAQLSFHDVIVVQKSYSFHIVNKKHGYTKKRVTSLFIMVSRKEVLLRRTNIKKKLFSAKICCKFLTFFKKKQVKRLKMVISTSVRSAQHPNAGRNIQQIIFDAE